jgi:hypothetical protein
MVFKSSDESLKLSGLLYDAEECAGMVATPGEHLGRFHSGGAAVGAVPTTRLRDQTSGDGHGGLRFGTGVGGATRLKDTATGSECCVCTSSAD